MKKLTWNSHSAVQFGEELSTAGDHAGLSLSLLTSHRDSSSELKTAPGGGVSESQRIYSSVLSLGSHWGLLETQERRFVKFKWKKQGQLWKFIARQFTSELMKLWLPFRKDVPRCLRRDKTQQNSEAWVKTKASEFHIKNWSSSTEYSGCLMQRPTLPKLSS